MAELNCVTDISNISRKQCEVNYGATDAVWLDPVNTGVADAATAILEATWTDKVNLSTSERMLVLSDFDNVEWDNEELQFTEGNMKKRKKLRPGHRRLTATIENCPRCDVEAYKKLDERIMYAYNVTTNGFIISGSSDDTKITPMKVQIFVDNEHQPNGLDENWRIMIYIDYLEPDNMNKKAVKPTAFVPLDIDGILDVEFTEVSAASGEVVVDITGVCDGREVTGLVVGDFTVTGLDSIASSGNRYTLTPTTTFTSPLTIALKNQPDMTTDGYEAPNSISVTF